MAHTFLFEPGVWTGTGTLWRADGEPLKTQSRTEIAHRSECWLLSGVLKVLGSPPTEFVHAYLIQPPEPNAVSIRWKFENAMFGTLQGCFAVIGDSLLSLYGSDVSGYRGSEHLGRIDDEHYHSAGMLLLKDRLLYSWQQLLERTPRGAAR
jgi:hypothetical protein